MAMLSTVSGPSYMLKLINQRRVSKREDTSQMKEMGLNDQLYKKITSNEVNVSPQIMARFPNTKLVNATNSL